MLCWSTSSDYRRHADGLRYVPKETVSLLSANVSMHQTNSGKSLEFFFPPTFIFCSPILSNNCGVVFLSKFILVFEK